MAGSSIPGAGGDVHFNTLARDKATRRLVKGHHHGTNTCAHISLSQLATRGKKYHSRNLTTVSPIWNPRQACNIGTNGLTSFEWDTPDSFATKFRHSCIVNYNSYGKAPSGSGILKGSATHFSRHNHTKPFATEMLMMPSSFVSIT